MRDRRIDERAHGNARVDKSLHAHANVRLLRHNMEPAFGRHLLAIFGNQTNIVRLHPKGDLDNVVGESHFEVELGGDPFAEFKNIAILDVATILPQMRRDPDSAGFFSNLRGSHRIGFCIRALWRFAVAGLPQGGDMVDVNSKTRHTPDHFVARFPGQDWRRGALPRA